MLKTLLAAALATFIAAGPAAAQDLCNDAHMKQMDKMIADMTDAAKQKEATELLTSQKRPCRRAIPPAA